MSINGHNSVANLPKFDLIKALMYVLGPARMKKIQLKMKALECSQDFTHYKSIGIFPDAQGQITLQSMVESGRISISTATLWLSSSPAEMKKIRSKMKELECSQHYTAICQTRKDS